MDELTLKEELRLLLLDLKEHVETRYDLARLGLVERASLLGSAIITSLIMGAIFLGFMLFVSIGTALYLGSLLGNPSLGFWIIAGVYVVLGVVIVWLRRWIIIRPIAKFLIGVLLGKDSHE